MSRPRILTPAETRQIGRAIGDFFVAMGHPLTCNGGRTTTRGSFHDYEVHMLFDGTNLVCPDCGRVQTLPENVLEKG